MHFIEQWFGVSPDGGSGATELLYVLVVTAVAILLIAGRYVRRRHRAGG